MFSKEVRKDKGGKESKKYCTKEQGQMVGRLEVVLQMIVADL